MTTEETRTINGKLDAILARVGGLESRMNGIETEFVGYCRYRVGSMRAAPSIS